MFWLLDKIAFLPNRNGHHPNCLDETAFLFFRWKYEKYQTLFLNSLFFVHAILLRYMKDVYDKNGPSLVQPCLHIPCITRF